MSKRVYYKIDCDESRQLQLSGSDKDVYFFVKAFREGVTMGQSMIAEFLCMKRETVCRALQRLMERGLIVRSVGYIYKGGAEYCYKVVKPCDEKSQGTVTKSHRVCDEKSQGTVTKSHRVCDKKSQGTPYIITSNNQVIYQPIIKGDSTAVSIFEQVLKVWSAEYKKRFGTAYLPDFRSVTTDVNAIAEAVATKMAEREMEVTADNVDAFLADMFAAMWQVADQWQREHWTLHTITIQFNELYNKINNGESIKDNDRAGRDAEFWEAFQQRYGSGKDR